ncbi:Hvo_1808 family surface protein [Halovivax gelatinilyticus]|uniref:Hvo_1808 family surface protein n=1 Tax=Halovivax gelatinilyticus TaxID=2961597 RepID=UPI0020CA7D65|nr:Hvo_1808 family surface protein [Halovivax gelatinilyticus]
MNARGALVLAALVAISLVAVPLAGAGGGSSVDTGVGAPDSETAATPADASVGSIWYQADERDENPTTESTVGYAEGYWYDDALPVDDRDGAHVSEDELQAVVYRSMARTEEIRGLTFQEVPDVDVVTREEFQEETDELFADLTERDELVENVRYEAFLMVDRETDAVEAFEALYGGAVGGYYDPAEDQIVLVSDDLEDVEVDEVTLGHELLHALQDQHFGLEGYDRETIDSDGAVNGLIEGDAVFVDEQYEARCGDEWDCLEPEATMPDTPEIVWGQYLTLIMPYDEGPNFVEFHYEQGGWDAIDALYDEPPASTSEVIRPGEERAPVDVEPADRSTDAWSVFEPDEGPTVQRVGEVGLVSMFMHDSVERGGNSVLSIQDWAQATADGGETYVYDQSITDGWAGDGLVVYTTDAETVDESAYVWETEWTSTEQANEFLDAYLSLLALHGGEPVEGVENTLTLDGGYPGAYHVDHDDETVTIVRAPTAADLPDVDAEAGAEGEDTIDHAVFGTDDAENDTDERDDSTDDDGDDSLTGFGPLVAIAALALAIGIARRR